MCAYRGKPPTHTVERAPTVVGGKRAGSMRQLVPLRSKLDRIPQRYRRIDIIVGNGKQIWARPQAETRQTTANRQNPPKKTARTPTSS